MNHKLRRWISMVVVILLFALESHFVLAADYPDKNAYDSTTTLKGVQGEQKYGSQHAFYNFDIRKCYIPDSYPECGLPYYEFEGKQYRFFDAMNFFSWLNTQNYAGRTANVQFMIGWEDSKEDPYLWQGDYPLRRILIDPAVTTKVPGVYYYAPASTGEGRQIMRAFWSWFMTELSKRQLHIDNFILGNEVNAPLYWHYSVDGAWTEKVQKYATSFYDMRQIIRSFSDKPRISICLDHSWTHNDEGRAIPAISYLSVFDAKLTELNDSKNVDDWCISMHLYPAVLTWPKIWTDKPNYPTNLNALSVSAPFVDGKNLSYITNYVKSTYGENHRIMLTEQGFTSHLGDNVQAASLVYSYYAAKYDPMVDCFILMVADSGSEMQFSIDGKLAGQIYPVIDDFSNQETVNNNLLSTIGVTSWSQIIPNYGQTIERKPYVGSGSKYVIAVSPSAQEGGSVTGAGTYEKGQEVTLTATPSSNYAFVAWKEGDDVVSTDATYVFTAMKKSTLVAEFLEKPWIAFEANGGAGSISDLRVEFETQYKLPVCSFTAPEGMEFDCWQIGSEMHHPGENITVNANTTIKAIWKAEEAKAIIDSASASFEGRIELNFYLRLSSLVVKDPGAKVVITKENATPVEIPVSQAVVVEDDGTQYCFIYPVVAKEIRDNVNIRVYDGEGNVIIFTNKSGENDYTASGVNYSVYTYATRMLEKGDDAMQVLAQALIDYGTAAQIYFKYGDFEPLAVSDSVTNVTLADMEGYAAKFYDGNGNAVVGSGAYPDGMTNRSIAVVFEADNTFKLYYEFADGVNPLPAEGNGPYAFSIDGNPATLHSASENYWLELANTPANRLGKLHRLSITDGTKTYTVECGALAYARSSAKSEDISRQNLGKALHLYYLAAKGKFGE